MDVSQYDRICDKYCFYLRQTFPKVGDANKKLANKSDIFARLALGFFGFPRYPHNRHIATIQEIENLFLTLKLVRFVSLLLSNYSHKINELQCNYILNKVFVQMWA